MEAQPPTNFTRLLYKETQELLLLGENRAQGSPSAPTTPWGLQGPQPLLRPPVPTHAWSSCSEAEVPGCSPGTGVTCFPKEGLAGGGTGGGRRRSVMQAGVGCCSWEPVRPQLRF